MSIVEIDYLNDNDRYHLTGYEARNTFNLCATRQKYKIMRKLKMSNLNHLVYCLPFQTHKPFSLTISHSIQ